MDLQIDVEIVNKKIIIRLDGRLDAITAPTLEERIERLLQEGYNQQILDFSRVDYLSSAGVRLLLATTKKLKAKKGHLILFSITDDVMEIIKMTGFERLFNICNREQEALQFTE